MALQEQGLLVPETIMPPVCASIVFAIEASIYGNPE